jgi:hypothetical protein
MDQVLARPEFEGWTKGEWCLEIIQTALRYYTRPRPAGEPGRRRAPAPAERPPETEPPRETAPAPEPRRRPEPEQPEPRRHAEPKQPQPGSPRPERPDQDRVEPDLFGPAEAELTDGVQCSHPAEARDYQSGTCAACGAILWD